MKKRLFAWSRRKISPRRRLVYLLAVILPIAFVAVIWPQTAGSQGQEKERPPFGSSLENLLWNPKTRKVIDSNAKKKRQTVEANSDKGEITLETTLAAFDVLVTDKQNKVITGLTKDDFLITEDNVPQQIGTCSLGNDVNLPRSIVLVIDYSGSQLPYIETSVDSAKILINQLGPKDRMAIVTDDVRLLVDFTVDKSVLSSTLDALRISAQQGKVGASRQFMALMAVLHELVDPAMGRSIIVFQTDGDEYLWLRNEERLRNELSRVLNPNLGPMDIEFSYDDLTRQIEHVPTTIYTVVPGEQLTDVNKNDELERGRRMWQRKMDSDRQLDKERKKWPKVPDVISREVNDYSEMVRVEQRAASMVATTSGGLTSFLESPAKANEIYTRILSDISNRYVIGYYPTNTTKDGKRRQVHIEVRGHPEYEVHGRNSYYAAEPDK
jgi:VWFA-related protein